MSNTVNRLIFDGQSLLSTPKGASSRKSPDGRDVTALFGATQTIRTAIKEYAPKYACVVIGDLSNNPAGTELKELSESLGLQVIANNSDHNDLIGSVISSDSKIPSLVITNNFGLARYINDRVSIQNAQDQTVVDLERLATHMGMLPEHLDLFVAITGDKERGISGIPMVGPKTALALVQEHADFRSLSMAANNPHTVALKSVAKHLDRIQRNLDVIQATNSISVPEPEARSAVDPKKLYPNYIKHGFGLWLPENLRQMHSSEPVTAKDLAVAIEINSQATLERAIKALSSSTTWAIHTSYNKMGMLRRIGICPQEGMAFDVDCSEQMNEFEKELISKLAELHDKRKPKIVCMDAKADFKGLSKLGLVDPEIYIDCKTLSYVLDPTNVIDQISSAAESKLGIVINSPGSNKAFNAYSSDVLLRLSKHLYKKAQVDDWAWKHFREIELPVSKTIGAMELTGAYINAEPLKALSATLDTRLREIENKMTDLAGESFNPNSTNQIANIIFSKLGLGSEAQKKKASTSEAVLFELSQQHELPALILEHRKLSNLNGPYTEGLVSKISKDTGRVHSTFNQTNAITGRLSSSDPNLQSIPVRSEEGKRIRQAFCGENGNRIIAADYSQIELRVLAHLSGDQKLISAFRNGVDIHQATAAEIFNIPLNEVTGVQRRSAKAINFGLIYGKTSYGLAKDLGISEKEAGAYINTYFARYPVVKSFLEQCKASARAKGYAETSSGRRIPVVGIHSDNYGERSKALRMACNYPMQGTAADIIKKAMIDTDKALRETGLNVKMIMQVHDELIFESSKADMHEAVEVIRNSMQNAFSLKVPLTVDVEAGLNWEQSHSIDAKTQNKEPEQEVAV